MDNSNYHVLYFWWMARKKDSSDHWHFNTCPYISSTSNKKFGRKTKTIGSSSRFLACADKEYAFPSGHATIVAAGVAVVLALYRRSAMRTFLSIILSIEAALVCISRVYVGAHYPLEVLEGILLGIGVSVIFVGSIKSIESRFMVPIKRKTSEIIVLFRFTNKPRIGFVILVGLIGGQCS